MFKIPLEQIEQARNIDLLTYLQAYEPYAIRKSGANEYCLVEHDSLKTSILPPPIGKDYNDTLCAILQLNKEKSDRNRHATLPR